MQEVLRETQTSLDCEKKKVHLKGIQHIVSFQYLIIYENTRGILIVR